MSTWAERVHRRAADIGNVVTSCGHPGSSASSTYPYRLEKVKFGVPLEEVCKKDNIPGPLLVLILKLNKESPYRRDIFRAPGHQGAMKKLIHFLQTGRLVNVANYSVYTIASVLKKFLRKIPNGIFGREGEEELFAINELQDETEQTQRLHRLFTSLPKYTQYLLVLLFGTFRVIASNAGKACTGMTSEALGVSVAPSFFQSCVSDGKTARMEDVLKFKVATKIMKNIIDKFATDDLFGRDNYEYYARVSGRILKVQDEWICSFQYPPPPRGKLAQQKYALQHSLEAEKTWLQCQCERWGLLAQEESRSTPALLTSSSSALDNSVNSLTGATPEHSFIESCARLSVSLEGPGLFALTSSPLPKRKNHNYEEDDSNFADAFAGVDDEDADDDGDDDDDEDDDDDNAFVTVHDENNPHHNMPMRYDLRVERKFNKTKKLVKDGENAGRACGGGGGGVGNAYDDDDDDEGDATVVKRRFRQNRKKLSTAQMRVQHQRRLRVGTKSLDGERLQTTMQSINDAGILKNSNTDVDAKNYALLMTKNANKTRTCSRCNRGIRHSSSCSSNSVAVAGANGGSGSVGAANSAAATTSAGGGGGVVMGVVGSGNNGANGSGMTMDELRAVNRYAESTKSLSYLPQVHERQTARMRTRSEWFLGPNNTCSNCYLAVQQEQEEQQQHQQQQQLQIHGYLGGGSTRDMRSYHNEFNSDNNIDQPHLLSVRNHHLFLTKQRKDSNFLQVEQQMMDTDDSNDYQQNPLRLTAQQQLQRQQIHSRTAFQVTATKQQQQQPDSLGVNDTELLITETAGAKRHIEADGSNIIGGHLYLDTNIVGNIRLSNSAESVQYGSTATARRTNSTRRLIGLNVPRQYPLRSSLRRNKEKQINSNSSSSSLTNNTSSNTINMPVTTLPNMGMLSGSNTNQPPSMRNSIAECSSNINNSNILTVDSITVDGTNQQTASVATNYSSNKNSMDTENSTVCFNPINYKVPRV